MYELRPARPLLVLDLSFSLKSRFLGRPALDRANRFVARRKEIGVAGFLGLLLFLATALAPASLGGVFAVSATVLYLPVAIAGMSLLRYEVVRLLLGTFDFWFATATNVSTFVVLALMLADSRSLIALTCAVSVQANIMIDANLRAIRVWIVLNILGAGACLVMWSSVAFKLLDRANDFMILGRDSNGLSAKAFVTDGLATVTTLVLRNVYRKRHALRRRLAAREFVECVSYRTDLRFVPCTRETLSRSGSLGGADKPNDTCPEYMKTMHCLRDLGLLDARHTLLQIRAISLTKAPVWFTTTFRWLGPVSAVASVCSVVFDVYVLPHIATPQQAHVPMAQVLATLLTTLYCGTFWLHCQRRLLRALWTSFDYLYLSLQLLVLHIGTCAIFAWKRRSCLAALVSFMWTHWVICIDAVPPVMRAKLGLDKRFALAVLLTLVGSSHVPLLLLVFARSSLHEVDFAGDMFGLRVHIELVPFFYGYFATACLLLLRLGWRAVRYGDRSLLVLDGPVVYENYLRTAQNRKSRRFGTIRQLQTSGINVGAAGTTLPTPSGNREKANDVST